MSSSLTWRTTPQHKIMSDSKPTKYFEGEIQFKPITFKCKAANITEARKKMKAKALRINPKIDHQQSSLQEF